MRQCEKDGCTRKHKAKGLCHKHYKQTDRYKSQQKEYNQSDKRQEIMRRYWKSDKYREYEKTPERKAKCKKFDSSKAGKISREKRRKTYNEKHPEKVEARKIAAREIERQECEHVNCNELGERHHDDYSKPLDVRFLCKDHHIDHHCITA